MEYLWIALFAFSLGLGWFLNLLGLPGNWLNVLFAVLFVWLFPVTGALGFGWSVVIAMALLAGLGDGIEFAASAAGLSKGGTRKGALFSILGSFVGSLFGATLGIIGILLLGSLGAMGGAILGEHLSGKPLDQSLELGKYAFFARILGTTAKILMGSIIVTLAVAAALF